MRPTIEEEQDMRRRAQENMTNMLRETHPETVLQYRSNRANTLHAAYLGSVRVGYVETRPFGRVLWQTILVRPEGGCYCGKEDDLESAKEALSRAVHHWLISANLQEIPK